MSKKYTPPYSVSEKAINLVAEISELIGSISVSADMTTNPKLRRENRIRTIHSSLAIENNTLTLDQVTDIINGKRVLGMPNEIREVKNAYEAYDILLDYDPYSISDFLKAHKILMMDLTQEFGCFRTKGVGVIAGTRVVHTAPQAKLVPELMGNLFEWCKQSGAHPLVKISVFHYELEFIHPFADGKGRMGRMWQTLILYQWKSIFAWLPVETLIHENQETYYAALAKSDCDSDSGSFIEYMLEMIQSALAELRTTDQVCEQVTDQVEKLLRVMARETYTAKGLMELVGIKHRPTFMANYMKPAIAAGFVQMTIPEKPNSSKQKYMKANS